MKILKRRWWLAAAGAVLVAVSAVLTTVGSGGANAAPARATAAKAGGLGQLTGLLPRNKLTEESALQVDLSKETVRLPLYPGTAHGKKVWYVLLDASDAGLAHDLGVNYAPKLANIAISDPAAVQTVTLGSPTPQQNPFGPAVVNFAGAPDFSPTRIATPGPGGFPLAKFQPGSVAGPGYSPFIKIAGSDVVYNAPIVASGDGPFDVTHHTNTEDRVLGIHIAGPSKPGQFAESWVDLLFVKGFDAGQPIVYLSTDAGQPLTAVLERSTYVPALNNASFNGGDDFLGSARERLFGFINGQTGAANPNAQGFVHLVKDGFALVGRPDREVICAQILRLWAPPPESGDPPDRTAQDGIVREDVVVLESCAYDPVTRRPVGTQGREVDVAAGLEKLPDVIGDRNCHALAPNWPGRVRGGNRLGR